MRKSYPSDITKEQFEVIRNVLESAKNVTSPHKYDLYDIFCAVLYFLKEGCRWRSLPHDFPNWETVYYHYSFWKKEDKDGKSILDKVLEKLVILERTSNVRSPNPTMTIIDSRSVKNTFVAEEKGIDGGKKNIGCKDTYRS